MDDQSRMKRALGHALPEHAPGPDPQQDLARARDALRDRSRRRFRLGLGALALAVIAGAGVAGVVERSGDTPASVTAAPIELLATTFHAKPYSFDLTPQGWSVQSRNPYFVTIVPDDGSASTDPDVFVGKLVISFDHNPLGGQPVAAAGSRQVRISGDTGYTTLSMRTEAGESAGVVRIQYPDDAGWDRAAMVRFLLSVHVGAGVKASLG